MLYRPCHLKHLILSSVHNLGTPWANFLSFLTSGDFQAKSFVQQKKKKQTFQSWEQ